MSRPIVSDALTALAAFNVQHAADAVVLLRMWARASQLTPGDWAEILGQFPGEIHVTDGFAEGYLAAMQHARAEGGEDLLADQPDEIKVEDIDGERVALEVEASLRAIGGDR